MTKVFLEEMAPKVLYHKITLQRENIDKLLDKLYSTELYSKEYHYTRMNFWNHWKRLKKLLRAYNVNRR